MAVFKMFSRTLQTLFEASPDAEPSRTATRLNQITNSACRRGGAAQGGGCAPYATCADYCAVIPASPEFEIETDGVSLHELAAQLSALN
jgi:hypothetical protein